MSGEEFDRILELAVASYSDREPRPGLEMRVLGRIQAEGSQRLFARWAFMIPVLAALVLAAIVFRPAPVPEPPRLPAQAVRGVEAPLRPPTPRPQLRVRAAGRKLPKRPVFPTPTPLTAGERALLAFIERSPEQARELFSPPAETSLEPIRIEEIREPLEMDQAKQEN